LAWAWRPAIIAARLFGDAKVGLPQPHPVLVGQAVEALDRGVQQLGVGREGDVLRLHRGVDRDPLKVLAPPRPCSRIACNV
jgi:hypothetical protein